MQTKRLAASFQHLTGSLVLSAGELWCCKVMFLSGSCGS